MRQMNRYFATAVLVLGVLILSACQPVPNTIVPEVVAPAEEPEVPEVEINKAVVRRVMEDIWNQGNLAVADEMFAASYVEHFPDDTEYLGLDGLKECVVYWRTAFPDLQFTVEGMVGEGNEVVVRWTARGTHGGEYMGIPATGERVVFTGNTTYRISDGKVQETWWEWDEPGLMQQLSVAPTNAGVEIGREVAISRRLQAGEEFEVPLPDLIEHGQRLFQANWTSQEGGGRPLTKGTGQSLSDPDDALVFPRNFNRISAPDSNSCAGCHNAPFGIAGGSGDLVTSVFVLGHRFDFATFDHSDTVPTKGSKDELGVDVTQQTIANRRATIGMFGSGYIEMLARQMTAELQALRDATPPAGVTPLVIRGVSFGRITRDANGNWITSEVEGLPAPSLATSGPGNPPSLIIRPFHQAGAVVSLREFTNNAFNHHHGIQSTERFGVAADPDGDGFVNELTRADVTASAIHQATLAVPGRVIPSNATIEQAVLTGEQKFVGIGCAECHIPRLPLTDEGWHFSEPNPYNPSGNLQVGEVDTLQVDLTSDELPPPRLKPDANGVVYVPAYTDFRLHDITTAADDDPNAEPLDMQQPAGSPEFFAGNRKFLTARLWGAANQPPYFHHGQFTTMREAILAHAGEAISSRQAFEALDKYEQDSIIEFLKTLQILPPGTHHLIVDEDDNPRSWSSPSTGALNGRAYLESRHAHTDIKISVGGRRTTTVEGGSYSISSLTDGVRTIRADYDLYLPVEKSDVWVLGGNMTTLPDVQLKAGDANDDDRIDILDLAVIGANYGGAPLSDPRADINADGACNLIDLAITGANYGLSAPTAWSNTPTMPAAAISSEAVVELSSVMRALTKVNKITTIDLRIQNASAVYAADLQLAFDPSLIEVLDEDAMAKGVQITPALDAKHRYIVEASADNQQGRVSLIFTLLRPATPSGGDTLLAQIRVKSKVATDQTEASGGRAHSLIRVRQAQLVDQYGREVPVKLAAGHQ
ncbi:MAG: hypothetical protein MAG451_02987 [Anaerolineales bacterium]|nr:hypothetical protein [Anaerolineales bacterium]